MEDLNKFEIHYHLTDNSHSMSALVRNKCEAELLAVAIEVADILGIHLELDCEALREGGVREIWKALGDNSAQIALLISTLALIWSIVPQTDNELLELQKEDLRLSIEQRKKALEEIKENLENGKITSKDIQSVTTIASKNYKIVTRKSNFYKILSTYEKVNQVGYSELNSAGVRISNEKIVSRVDFSKFILISHDLKSLTDSSAYIEIVSPVLTEGKAKWKGIYNEQLISFSMNDNDFKMTVLSKQRYFKNGDGIICILRIFKKLNEVGDIVTSGYAVETVLENVLSGISSETSQGKRVRHTKKMLDGQSDMFTSK